MSVLTEPPSGPAETWTLEQKQLVTFDRVSQTTDRYWPLFKIAQWESFDLIWKNPYGLTPQQAVDALGTLAVRFFNLHRDISLFIAAQQLAEGKPVTVSTPPKNFTRNEDGTVTILDEDYTG